MIFSLRSFSESDAARWLGASEIALLIFTAVLAFGLVGEWSEADIWKKSLWYKLAKASVIIGVIGEFLGDGAIFELSARLQVLQKGSIAEASQKAEAADERARQANAYAADATRATEELRAANIAAQRDLERERKERLELQGKFAWRHLNDDQLGRVLVALLRFPNMPYDREIADAESLNLLSEMSKVLTSTAIHWIAKQDSGRLSIRDSAGITIGILIWTDVHITYGVTRESDFGAAAKALASALAAEGIKATADADPSETETTADQRIHIKIGSKPAF